MKPTGSFDFETARRLRGDGMGFAVIARHLGCSPSTVFYHLDPQQREQKRNSDRKSAAVSANGYIPNKTHATALERLSEIPRDTRNLTQMAFGDPIPCRSALAKRDKETIR